MQTQLGLSAYSVKSADVSVGKSHSVCSLLRNENGKILPVECCTPHTQDCREGCELLPCDTEAFVMRVFGYFSVSSKHVASLNEILDWVEVVDRCLHIALIEGW